MLPDHLNHHGISELTRILEREKAINADFSYSYDPATKRLTIRGASSFPALYNFAELVEILDMSYGHMSNLPADFHRMSRITVAFFSHNDFDAVPSVLGHMPSLKVLGMKSCRIASVPEDALSETLRWLTLTDNLITHLPAGVGNLKELEKLLLAGNGLSELPDEIGECRKLALIRISANRFKNSPLEQLSHLPGLAWYADAGNPFSPTPAMVSTPTIPWAAIELGELLGESAQNKVYRAQINVTGEDVAVKMYGGDVTSDGYAQDDMRASLAAGAHQHLVGAIGQIIDMPSGQNALVLPLVPASFHKLGCAPNLETCSRDTYPDNTEFSTRYSATVLYGIAQACIHLHSQGIMHGDLYAHNTLVDGQGYAYLGDFGSASFYNRTSERQRERIDVQAFGYLMDDLLTRCSDKDHSAYQTFDALRKACLAENYEDRPTFQEVGEILGAI